VCRFYSCGGEQARAGVGAATRHQGATPVVTRKPRTPHANRVQPGSCPRQVFGTTDYGPFEAGVRTLPVATSVAIASSLGTKLAVRFGTKLIVALGV